MHSFTVLVDHYTSFTLDALRQANESVSEALQTSAATRSVKALHMVPMQKDISAAGMFSIFEAMLQDGLECKEGFREAQKVFDEAGGTALKGRFVDLQFAVNVLKHGRGRSCDALVAEADRLPFRVKQPGEGFFFEGDVSEVATLIEVDDAFVLSCAEILARCRRPCRKHGQKSSFNVTLVLNK